jgi:hypothetical protein
MQRPMLKVPRFKFKKNETTKDACARYRMRIAEYNDAVAISVAHSVRDSHPSRKHFVRAFYKVPNRFIEGETS